MTRGQKLLAVVAVVIIALYVTGAATQNRSTAPADPSQHGLVKALGGLFGGPPQARLDELAAPCLSGDRLSIKDSCVLTVASSDEDIREVRLKPDRVVSLKTRAPRGDSPVEETLEGGSTVDVAVDGDGVEIRLVCKECTVIVGGE
ncbi:hypothetical protein [Allorhizocola rhizosphaerae]|uniref:hypothetical protein n=1 Tax=Allorhizocola rhizosphaerae TaxID=1872709 RepID=UPI0013C2A1BE|nr:hypothetical protein [Allorhizocola rhizosphaerae]